ncbi:twin-arginine translocation signal domain-containing protein [Haloterrigena alkaliphila]|uniref:Twin-arginine translocation signal domain-containing protein n=1 Tax=Haloterrigena alkaliphila TaxID=2816475 RepID=A0A8A2VDC0_9EURY|nr:twin-arginine translocation signal domain-containing protein [Haloterrigena alkaliphila]QSW98434.1 twin-arginine translocation signal domain-containing protein [Haloterrigena alkaliphila]
MQSRRNFLRAGTGAALLATLAGCSDESTATDDGDTDDQSDSDDAVTEIEPADWVYDPASMDRDSITATLRDAEALFSQDSFPNEEAIRSNFTGGYDGQLAVEDVATGLEVGGTHVLTGTFDATALVEGLAVSSAEAYGGFDVYAHESASRLFAVGDGYLLKSEASSGYDLRGELELLIDTYNGDPDGFVDVDDDYALVSDELGAGHVVHTSGMTESAAADADAKTVIANGESFEIDGTETRLEWVELYKHADGIDVERLESELTNVEEIELNTIEQDGRLLTVEITIPTEKFL